MNNKKVGDTFIDNSFRRWQVIAVNEGVYDCQFVEFLDGDRANTPPFKTFKFIKPKKQEGTNIQTGLKRLDPAQIQKLKDILESQAL